MGAGSSKDTATWIKDAVQTLLRTVLSKDLSQDDFKRLMLTSVRLKVKCTPLASIHAPGERGRRRLLPSVAMRAPKEVLATLHFWTPTDETAPRITLSWQNDFTLASTSSMGLNLAQVAFLAARWTAAPPEYAWDEDCIVDEMPRKYWFQDPDEVFQSTGPEDPRTYYVNSVQYRAVNLPATAMVAFSTPSEEGSDPKTIVWCEDYFKVAAQVPVEAVPEALKASDAVASFIGPSVVYRQTRDDTVQCMQFARMDVPVLSIQEWFAACIGVVPLYKWRTFGAGAEAGSAGSGSAAAVAATAVTEYYIRQTKETVGQKPKGALCKQCHKKRAKTSCKFCKTTLYCGEKCRRADWAAHTTVCPYLQKK